MVLLILTLFLLKVDVSHNYNVQINTNCVCGVPNIDLGERIVGGTVVDAHRFPWMVAVVANNAVLCGGALINDRYVLTAGHCVHNMTTLDVLLGKHNLRDMTEGVIVSGVESKVYPDFFSEYVRDINDIALIKLKPLNYTTNIRPICLPNQDRNYTREKVQIAGWGSAVENGSIMDYQKQTTVEVISLEECANTTDGPYINGNMLCTYASNADSCTGDSGGPLQLEREKNKYETIGVISWGFGCARKGSPAANAKVAHYLDWILSETQDSIYCKNE